ncbi:pyridoxal 5'-phosphate synthase glutaminase subunit PdxT [Heyndrickxia coagulans]|uniref:Pyridoxal 5'-phosphate synthase subunit PdxT n=1 Tax=Heyndrickxia coagulans TaxID=1398 RepID=A0AAW7CLW5_HEYCO|nr:pyridoxal 5'-phosphate synthase glutaminase subunit PdxT [Heyndrickxia coagulans]MDL5041491.1 pyridoxal 5'-phosphate synthase glutaminase subunit PdxT [Heyndrickxia coagulans]
MKKIGVLGLQGAVEEHIRAVEACGAEGVVVKKKEQLDEIDGLILPGGESTAMRRLIDRYGFMAELKQFAESKPVFGTCAGLILLAKRIEGQEDAHIGAMDITVARNSFGRQRESFEETIRVNGIAEDFPAVFIRAPHIVSVSDHVEVLAECRGRIVAVRQGNLLGCSFHPELTDDLRMTEYFLSMARIPV